MTDTSNFQARTVPLLSKPAAPARPLLTETYWGFTIKSTLSPSFLMSFKQGFAMIGGAGFAAITLGLWSQSAVVSDMASISMRLGLSVFAAMASYMLITYANRGTASELQFDCSLGELREVVRSRSGKSVLLAHYGFDAFSGLTIDRSSGDPADVKLVLQHQDPADNILVANSTESQIGEIYGRLERDMLRENGSRSFGAVAPARL